jgi:hypothetical protein
MLLKDRLAVLDVQVVGQAPAVTTLSAIGSGGGGLTGPDRPSGEVVWPDALMLVASRFASVYRAEAGGWGRRFLVVAWWAGASFWDRPHLPARPVAGGLISVRGDRISGGVGRTGQADRTGGGQDWRLVPQARVAAG